MSRRVLVVTTDHVGRRMAGPAIRAVNVACELVRREFEVTLAAPNAPDAPIDGVAVERLGPHDARRAIALGRQHDAVVTQRLPARAMVTLARSETRVVYDLYDPVLHELVAAAHGRPRKTHDHLDLARNQLVVQTALRAGDAFVCASERQRDLWLGALGAAGRLDHEEYARDPSLRALIDVVPFGIDPSPPRSSGSVLRGTVPGFDERSKVLVWGGGVWNWLDPVTIIRAVHELSQSDKDVRLLFLGVRRPNAWVTDTAMLERAMTVARDLGSLGSTVVFNEDWVPYAERSGWLSEADIGVSAHFDTLETRFAFRTRLLDYLWAGLPIATTGGDVMGELVEREGLGATLPAENVEAWIAALRRLLDDKEGRHATRARIEAVRERFEWPRVVDPLVRLLEARGRRLDLEPHMRLAAARELYLGARSSVHKRGVAASVKVAMHRDERPE